MQILKKVVDLPWTCLLSSCSELDIYFDGKRSLNSVIGMRLNIPNETEVVGEEPAHIISVTC